MAENRAGFVKGGFLGGFTIIESIVTIVVLAIIAYSVTLIVVEGFKVWFENKDYIELRADGRYALKRLAGDLRQAEAITVPAEDTQGSTLTFASDADDNGVAESITYTLSGTNMDRDSSHLSGFIGALDFARNDPVITVNMTLTKNSHTVTLRREIAPRCLP